MKQSSFDSLTGFEVSPRKTRKASFLHQMESLIPWTELTNLIQRDYPKAANGRPPIGAQRMLRMYLISNWFNLSDQACEDALYDTPIFRHFCGIDLGNERVPDATTLLRFRHFLQTNDLGIAIFNKINELLIHAGMSVNGGTIVDATLISAPGSTKNQDKKRDPQMSSTKKGNQFYFGMKVHIGMNSQSGLIHHACITAANVHDSQKFAALLTGQETRLYGDSAYHGKNQKNKLKELAPRAKDFTNRRAYINTPLSAKDKKANRYKSSIRSKVEHAFLTLKRHWGFYKARYRGLAKNANKVFVMLAMINILKWAKPLKAPLRLI